MIVPYEPHPVQKDTVLFKEGMKHDYIYLVKSGDVVILKENAGRVTPVKYCGEKDFIGLNDQFVPMCKSSAVTLGFTEVIPLPKSDVREILENSPKWINLLLHTLTDRLEDSVNFVSEHFITEEFEDYDGEFTEEVEIRLRKVLKDYQG